jgi:ribosome-associated protein YbcJ (S4-like RNA binding protein)
MTKRTVPFSTMLSLVVSIIGVSSFRTLAFSSSTIVDDIHHRTSTKVPFCTRITSQQLTSSIYKSTSTINIRSHHATISLSMTTGDDDDNGKSIIQQMNKAKALEDMQQSTLPLCDLQTFLRLCNVVDSGGQAKTAIQNSQILLNGIVETRRSKKLFDGDKVVSLLLDNNTNVELDVASEVQNKGYVYKPKVKKVKPLPGVDEDGNIEFGGRYRSEEWRAERKMKKADRKKMNTNKKSE